MYIWKETMMNIYNRYNHYIGEIPDMTFELLYSQECHHDNIFVAWLSDEFGIIYKILYDGE